MYINQSIIGGRLVADPMFSKSEDPTHDRVWGRVACNRQGEGADFIPFVAWGASARATVEHCKKGKMLFLVGSLRTRSEKLEDGTYKNYFEVNCSTVHFGPDAKNTAPAEATKPAAAAPVMPALTPEMLAMLAAALGAAKTAPVTEPLVAEYDGIPL